MQLIIKFNSIGMIIRMGYLYGEKYLIFLHNISHAYTQNPHLQKAGCVTSGKVKMKT